MLLQKIQIEKFRAFQNTTINLGSVLTIIAGQNGTGKSTLLGMLGQPFNFKPPTDLKNFFGISAKTEFSDIFKFSPNKDIPGEHIYFLYPNDPSLHPDGKFIQIKSYKRTEKDENGKEIKDPNRPSTFIRLVTGKKRGEKDAGGNIDDIPVVYLGLRRLQPLGEEKNLIPGKHLSTDDEKYLIKKHKLILKLNHLPSTSEAIHSLDTEEEYSHLGYSNAEYDEYANSAGQDNVNKILIAILFLQKIKAHLKKNYKGGLLLVDEIDATLFPASQEALVDQLIRSARELNFQIIATTHSLNLLKHLNSHYANSKEVTTVFLRNIKTSIGEYVVESTTNPTWEFIENNLEVMRTDNRKIKVKIFREDIVTEFFTKKILGPRITPNLQFEQLDFGYQELKKLSKYNIPLFQQALFIVDGDVSNEVLSNIKHGVRLPGNERPEKLLFEFIRALPDTSSYWDAATGKTSQQCFQNFSHIGQAKEWFQQLSSKDRVAFFNLWKKSYSEQVKKFKENFIKIYNQQAKLIGAKQL